MRILLFVFRVGVRVGDGAGERVNNAIRALVEIRARRFALRRLILPDESLIAVAEAFILARFISISELVINRRIALQG